MIDLRTETSSILGTRVEEGHWDEAFLNLDKSGKLTQKMMFQLIVLILKKLDEKGTI
jgi:hypothetical protein